MNVYASNNVTIGDIAARLGVSTATVSMALSGKGRISAALRKTICKTAHEMGYEANRYGHALRMKNITIGVMLPKSPAVVQEHLKRGILEACRESRGIKFRCLMLEYDYNTASEAACFRTLLDSCDGMIIEFEATREEPHRAVIEQINARHLPAVSLVVQPALLHTDLRVSVDAEAEGRLAADLFHLGLPAGAPRDILVVGGAKKSEIHERVLRAFREAAAPYGLRVCETLDSNDDPTTIPPLLRQALARQGELAGVFVTSYLSYCVCRELRLAGRADRTLVVGVDVFRQNAACLLNGTLHALIHQQQQLQAKTAFHELMNRLLNAAEPGPKTIQIPGQIVLPGNIESYLGETQPIAF